ncbi:MAG: Hpt domain-containing protein, partial [Coriobacteriia bacterium]|nr:Hpt domain-containing protein [Coriobacteriia bacterium]
MSDDMSAYKEVFLSESAEYIQSITDGLLALESDPHDLQPVEVVFRGAHSLKGMAAAMGYTGTTELTHKMESLMDTVRQKAQPIDSSLIDLMLRAVDGVRDLVADESSGTSSVDVSQIVEALVARTQVKGSEPGAAPTSPDGQELVGGSAMAGGGSLFLVKVTLVESCVLKAVRAYMAIKRLGHMGTVIETHPSAAEIEDEEFDRSFEVVLRSKEGPEAITSAVSAISEMEGVVVTPMEEPPAEMAPAHEPRSSESRRSIPKIAETQTVRISIGHLDSMVNLVGELVIIRSRLDKIARDVDSSDLRETLGVLEQVSADLQHEVMQTRMVPVGNIFNRFPR